MTPQQMWCNQCGDRFNHASTAMAHTCRPNTTGLNVNEPVLVHGYPGVVQRVDRDSVEVYFRSSFRAQWYAASECERTS